MTNGRSATAAALRASAARLRRNSTRSARSRPDCRIFGRGNCREALVHGLYDVMGHVSGHSVPVPHLGREGAAAHGRLPAAHGRRSRARVGGDGMAAAAPRRAAPLRAVLLAAAPWLVTGFLHLDGYMDVCDALLSRRDLTTRQKILKDSHCGAFAVICMVLLAACQCALFAGAPWLRLLPLGALPWRAAPALPLPCSACARWARASMPPCSAERACSSCSHSCACWRPALCRLCSAGRPGLRRLLRRRATALPVWRGFRQLDGMSGDISGFGLTLGELAGAAVLCLVR